MHTRDTDTTRLPMQVDSELAIAAKGNIVLRDLIALHKVRVVITFAIKFGKSRDRTVQSETSHNGIGNGLSINHRENSRHAHTDGAHMGIWWGVGVVSAASTKHLAICQQL